MKKTRPVVLYARLEHGFIGVYTRASCSEDSHFKSFLLGSEGVGMLAGKGTVKSLFKPGHVVKISLRVEGITDNRR